MWREVPEAWHSTTLGEHIAEMRGGGTPSRKIPEYWTGSIPWASVKDLKGRYIDKTEESISEDGLHSSASNLIPKGTLVLATRMAVGKAVRFSKDVAINQDLRAIFPRPSLNIDFLHQWFVWQEGRIARLGSGTTVAGIRQEMIRGLPLALPPLTEQRRIAEILSSVDEAIAAKQAVIKQTRKVKQGVLERLLAKGIGHTSFKQTQIGEIPEAWDHCALAEAASIKHGYAFSGEFFSKEEGPSILLTPGNFSKEKTLYFGPNTKFYQGPTPSDFILKNGDLVVVMTDLTPSMEILGNAVILNSDKVVLHNQRIGKVEVDNNLLSTSFVKHVLDSERVQRQIKKTASGTTVRHTSPSRILENVTVLPPMEEQLSIVEALRMIDDGLYLQIQHLERACSLKSALMSDLLSGRKRVTDAIPIAAE
ncbi:restriction endonuclease subunit S [Agrobacterium tumefaciens]|uniref:restriction endonuclease subunit S n=1 Tax=Agrobacterium tumefaciens TaxID=358 RepID=UPI0016597683|nr:restriction endonuclease subunit S [Agrobacterium tumefaciens]QNP81959.1 restriction endonuclease subunit S [Agrobacterium tumefaciens]